MENKILTTSPFFKQMKSKAMLLQAFQVKVALETFKQLQLLFNVCQR